MSPRPANFVRELEKNAPDPVVHFKESGTEEETQAQAYRRVELRRGRRKRKLTPCRRRRSQGRRGSRRGAGQPTVSMIRCRPLPGAFGRTRAAPSAARSGQAVPVRLRPPIGSPVLRRPARRAPSSRVSSAPGPAPRSPGCTADDLLAALSSQAPSSRARRPFRSCVPGAFWAGWREEVDSPGSPSIQAPEIRGETERLFPLICFYGDLMLTLNCGCFFLLPSHSRFGRGLRASAADQLWERASGTRAPGTGTHRPGGRRAQGPRWAKTPTHPQLLLAPDVSPTSSPATPAREAGAGLRRRTKAPGTEQRRTSSRLHRGPPAVAPIPRLRVSVTCVINKSSGAGGKLSGAKLKSADSAFVERGATITAAPGPALLEPGNELREQGVSCREDSALRWWGAPRDFLTPGISVRTLDPSQQRRGPGPGAQRGGPRGNAARRPRPPPLLFSFVSVSPRPSPLGLTFPNPALQRSREAPLISRAL